MTRPASPSPTRQRKMTATEIFFLCISRPSLFFFSLLIFQSLIPCTAAVQVAIRITHLTSSLLSTRCEYSLETRSTIHPLFCTSDVQTYLFPRLLSLRQDFCANSFNFVAFLRSSLLSTLCPSGFRQDDWQYLLYLQPDGGDHLPHSDHWYYGKSIASPAQSQCAKSSICPPN